MSMTIKLYPFISSVFNLFLLFCLIIRIYHSSFYSPYRYIFNYISYLFIVNNI